MKLYKRRDRKGYYIRHRGKLISLGTSRKAWALQLLEDYQAKALGIYRVPKKRLRDLVEPYLTRCSAYNKATTIDDKKRTLELFATHTNNPWLGQVDRRAIEGYLGARVTKRAISADRWNSERQILNNFFRYLIDERMLRENPCAGVEKRKTVKGRAKSAITLTQEAELDKYLAHGAERAELKARRYRGLSEEAREEAARVKAVAINTGLRARELVNLAWHDIDFDRATVRVSAKPDWQPKDYEERTIPANKATLAALREQKLKRSIVGKYVFCRQDGKKYGRGLDAMMHRAFIWAGFEHGGLHTLRHTFATRYLQRGGNLEDLRDLLGHSDIRTTQRYLHGDSEEQRKMVNRL